MDLDYDELMRIYRLEKNSSRHAEVEETFFDDLRRFFKKEKKEYLRSLKDITSSKARGFSNMRKIIEQIFSLREKKLLNKALVANRTGELDNGNMALQERETLKHLLKALEGHQRFLGEILNGGAQKAGSEKAVAVKMLQNVPAFVGSDMKEYGPFEKDKAVSLPPKIAELLVSRKLAGKGGK